jgi:hypothetical protein
MESLDFVAFLLGASISIYYDIHELPFGQAVGYLDHVGECFYLVVAGLVVVDRYESIVK